ncbi:hypothetical protein BTA51_29565 [Hahella sp. CCB-MM4]|nr:hypothetical protein BTA51_29565 [Hahella sp. CCB-MM4]
MRKPLLLLVWAALLSACSDNGAQGTKNLTDQNLSSAIQEELSTKPPQDTQADKRWYSAEQVSLGKTVYEQHCISCHLPQARGTFNWKKPTEDGSYPPPPLNGSAHAWHHPLPALLQTINEGGAAYGGKMPPFQTQLNDSEKNAVIAYFQSFWSNEIYLKWESLHDQ